QIVEIVHCAAGEAGKIRLRKRAGDLQGSGADAADTRVDAQLLCGAANGRLREVRGHRHGGARVVKRNAQIAQVPAEVLRGEGGLRSAGGRQVKARTLIVREKEELVLLDGSAEGGSVFIPALARGRHAIEVIAPLVGVEKVIAEILEQVAVEAVGPALQADADHSAEELAVFGIRVIGKNLELLNGIDVR